MHYTCRSLTLLHVRIRSSTSCGRTHRSPYADALVCWGSSPLPPARRPCPLPPAPNPCLHMQLSEALSSPQLAEAVRVLQQYYSMQQLQVGGTQLHRLWSTKANGA